MKKFKKWVYSSGGEAKIVWSDEAEEYYKNGWGDSPARFDKPEPEPDEPPLVGAMTNARREIFEKMSKKELVDYAKTNLSVELDLRDTKLVLIEKIEAGLKDSAPL